MAEQNTKQGAKQEVGSDDESKSSVRFVQVTSPLLKIPKVVRMILAILLVIALSGAGYLLWRHYHKPKRAPVASTAQAPTTEQVTAALSQTKGQGTVKSVSADAFVITVDGTDQTFNTTSQTLYQKGNNYIDGLRSEITPGKKVGFMYDFKSKQISAIWYDQQ